MRATRHHGGGARTAGLARRVRAVAAALLLSATAAATAAAQKPVPKVDGDMQAVLDRFYSVLHPIPYNVLPPPQARREPTVADAVKVFLLDHGRDTSATALVPGVTSVDRVIQTVTVPLTVRIYTPAGHAGRLPVVVYFHGGGWVLADRNVYDGGARGLSKTSGAIVVSVDYRLGPENRFPAAHDDALASYRWVLENAASIGGDPTRVALAGESAGGNLAVATAFQARDAGLRRPTHVLSVYPIAQPDTATPAYLENANARPLNRALMKYFFANYPRSPADLLDPRINLVGADLRGLPPVTILNAEIDPLRDDGLLLERALRAAGVTVDRHVYDGVTHEFFGMAAVVEKARAAQEYGGAKLRASFSAP